MRTVWIIGTSHNYQQLRLGANDLGPEQFRVVLTAISSDKGVRAMGEEMSLESLELNGAYDSVCRQVAHALGIPHRYCDPCSEERRDLGIIKGDPLLESRLWADCEEREFEPQVRDSYERRRRRCLEHLLELNAWPSCSYAERTTQSRFTNCSWSPISTRMCCSPTGHRTKRCSGPRAVPRIRRSSGCGRHLCFVRPING